MTAKKVLLTGAFGNIGSLAIRELLLQGYSVVAFDKDGPITRKNAKPFSDTNIRIVWGDITVKQNIEAALQGVDAVIHLAGIIPPLSESNPKLCHAVNVDGTRFIIEAMQKLPSARRLVIASSIAVYGKKQWRFTPPLTSSDPVAPDDIYGKSKAECEAMAQSSSLDWTIMRIAACPPVNINNMDSFKGNPVLDCHPDCRLEVIHPADAALAFVNALSCEAAIGKILLLGGGKKNQVTIQQQFAGMLTAIGQNPVPREAFHMKEPIEFYGDWVDTEESQRLLKFQRHSVQQQHQEFWQSVGLIRYILLLFKPLAPLASWAVKQFSPYYKKQTQRH